jgi:hypothetical protein
MLSSATRLSIQTSTVGHIARLAYALAQRKAVAADQLLAKAALSPAEINNPNARS